MGFSLFLLKLPNTYFLFTSKTIVAFIHLMWVCTRAGSQKTLFWYLPSFRGPFSNSSIDYSKALNAQQFITVWLNQHKSSGAWTCPGCGKIFQSAHQRKQQEAEPSPAEPPLSWTSFQPTPESRLRNVLIYPTRTLTHKACFYQPKGELNAFICPCKIYFKIHVPLLLKPQLWNHQKASSASYNSNDFPIWHVHTPSGTGLGGECKQAQQVLHLMVRFYFF